MTEFGNRNPTEQIKYDNTKPYTDLRFSIWVQTKTSDGQKMLHITSSINTICEYETIPISHITEEVVANGNQLDTRGIRAPQYRVCNRRRRVREDPMDGFTGWEFKHPSTNIKQIFILES